MIDVVDDFLPDREASVLEDLMINSGRFPWFVSQGDPDGVYAGERLHNFKFTHVWFSHYEWVDDPVLVKPMLERLSASSIVRVKANLQTFAPSSQMGEWHSDECDPYAWTAVYYVNTCNGYTEFRDGSVVDSRRGRLVRFPNMLEHRSVSATDANVRAVINFNYCTIGGAMPDVREWSV